MGHWFTTALPVQPRRSSHGWTAAAKKWGEWEDRQFSATLLFPLTAAVLLWTPAIQRKTMLTFGSRTRLALATPASHLTPPKRLWGYGHGTAEQSRTAQIFPLALV